MALAAAANLIARTSAPSHQRQGCASAGSRRLLVIFMLALILQFAQWLGLAHGIAHAGWPVTSGQAAQASRNAALFNYIGGEVADAPVDQHASGKADAIAGHHQQHHSCVEYDAAAGAAGIHVGFFAPPLLPGVHVLALWQAFGSWDAPFVCHFSSRAPPR